MDDEVHLKVKFIKGKEEGLTLRHGEEESPRITRIDADGRGRKRILTETRRNGAHGGRK